MTGAPGLVPLNPSGEVGRRASPCSKTARPKRRSPELPLFPRRAPAVLAAIGALAALGAAPFPSSSTLPPNPDETASIVRWFRIDHEGRPVGRLREARKGAELRVRSELSFLRDGATVPIWEEVTFRRGGTPSLERALAVSPADTLRRTVLFEGDSLRLLDRSSRSLAAWPRPEDLVLPDAWEEWYAGADTARTHSASLFSLDLERPVAVRIRCLGPAPGPLREPALRWAVEIPSARALDTIELRAGDGRLLALSHPTSGLSFEAVEGMPSTVDAPPDIFAATWQTPGFHFDAAATYERIVYRARSEGPAGDPFAVLASRGLEILSRDGLECVFVVDRMPVRDSLASEGKARPGPTRSISAPESEPDPATLRPGELIDFEEPRVHQAAREAAPDGPPEFVVAALTDFVRSRIRPDYSTHFGSASSALRSGRGDCTESAVLLAALCRARGIPARLVAGWIGIRERMGYHLWTEVYLDGRWIGADAAWGRWPTDARYIPVSASDLADDHLGELFLAVLATARGVQIEVIETRGAAKTDVR